VTRTMAVVFLALWCATGALAQRSGGGRGGGQGRPGMQGAVPPGVGTIHSVQPAVPRVHAGQFGSLAPRTFGSPHGFGNVVFPGTGGPPNSFIPFGVNDLGFASRLSQTISGNPFGPTLRRPHRGQAVVVPYAVPYYMPYPEPQPPITIVAPPPQVIYVVPGEPDRSVATVAPETGRTGIVTYVVPSREPGAAAVAPAAPRLYLIALKNHSIYTAAEYWVEDGTLHYVTTFGVHNQASLDQVDLEFTTRLNRERGLDFRLDP
jgi:hypothetical protein